MPPMFGPIRRTMACLALASFAAQAATAASLCCDAMTAREAAGPTHAAGHQHQTSDDAPAKKRHHGTLCFCAADCRAPAGTTREPGTLVLASAREVPVRRSVEGVTPLGLAARDHFLPLPQAPPRVR